MLNFGQVDAAPSLDLTSQFLPGLLASENNDGVPTARRRTWATHFMPEHLYEYYAQQSALTASALPGTHDRVREVPKEYTSVMVLDRSGADSSAPITGSYGYISTVYKGISIEDGMAYALRRVDNVRAHPKVLHDACTAWSAVSHPSVIRLRKAFSNTGVGPGSVFFVHDYFPGAKTVLEALLDGKSAPVPERTLWSYICQLVMGLRAVHEAGLSFRGLEASHVLVTGHNRMRLGGAGILDVLESDSKKNLTEMQSADMLGLGHLILQIATRSAAPHRSREQIEPALAFVHSSYSYAVSSLVILLLSRPVSVQELCRNLAPHMMAELDSLYDHADAMDEVLAREFENGRMFRSLTKLGFINERPAFDGDASWSETGERYSLKLFRDFLFHQITDEGRPVLDVAHVVDALRRLDKGTNDKILLSSRDGATLLVTSYNSMKKAINSAYDDLKGDFGKEPVPAGPPAAVRRLNRTAARTHGRPAALNAHAAALSAASFLSSVTEAANSGFPISHAFSDPTSVASGISDYPGSYAAGDYGDAGYAGYGGAAETYGGVEPTYQYYAQGAEGYPVPAYESGGTTADWGAAEDDRTNLNAGAPEFKPSWAT